MCAVIVDYNGGFIFFAAVQKFIILFNHVAEDSIKVRANKKWTIKKHNQHWTEDTERKQTKQKTQHRKLKI